MPTKIHLEIKYIQVDCFVMIV